MKKGSLFSFCIIYIWLGIFSLLVYFELWLGASNSFYAKKYFIHNVIICLLVNIVLFNLIRRKSILFIISAFTFIWSIISHFVLQLHGSALCFSLFKNFKTAVTVINNYNISIDSRVVFIIFVFAINVALIYFFPKQYVEDYSKKIHIAFKLLFFIILFGYSFLAFKIANTNMSWAPFFIIEQRGYISYLITDSIYCFNHFSKPDGYSEELIPTNIEGWDDNISETKPDIILILNESFSDITKYSNVKTDIDPLESLNDID